MTKPPRFKVKGGKLRHLIEKLDKLSLCVAERTPNQGRGTKLTTNAQGFTIDANPGGTGDGSVVPRWG